MKKRIITPLLIALLGSSITFAETSNTVTVINATQKNIHFQYLIDNANKQMVGGGMDLIFTNDPSATSIDLTKSITGIPSQGEILYITNVDEVDFSSGNYMEDGMHGKFDQPACTAKAGQSILLEQAGNKLINCKVIG